MARVREEIAAATLRRSVKQRNAVVRAFMFMARVCCVVSTDKNVSAATEKS